MKVIHTLAKITFFFTAIAFAKIGEAQEVKLQGQILRNYNTIENVAIAIYRNDSLIKEIFANNNGKFKLAVDGSSDYELVFSKEKYQSKTIYLRDVAKSGYEKNKTLTFKFDVELDKEKEFRYVDTSELESPVAVIFYNLDKEKLDWDRDHTFKAHEGIAQLKDLNDEKRREQYRRF